MILKCYSTINIYDKISSCKDNTFVLKSSSKFHNFYSSIIEEDNNPSLNETYTIIFAIKQNYDEIKKILYDVSFPDSPNYRKYLSRNEIGKISSNPMASKKVIDILHNIDGISIINTTIDD